MKVGIFHNFCINLVKVVVMYTRWVPLTFIIHNTKIRNSSDYAMALFYNEWHAHTGKPLKSAGISNWWENMCIKQLFKVERSTTSPYIHTSDSYFSKGRHNPSVPFT